jgi:hypothetical protein
MQLRRIKHVVLSHITICAYVFGEEKALPENASKLLLYNVRQQPLFIPSIFHGLVLRGCRFLLSCSSRVRKEGRLPPSLISP